MRARLFLPLLLAAAVPPLAQAGLRADPAARPLRWKKTVLDRKFRAEGAAVADVNRDGRPDVLAGNLWYQAPDWTPHEIRPAQEFNPATGYSNCFLTFASDIDRDGWPDQIVVGYPGQKAVWFRNPGGEGTTWTEHLVTESACNESPVFADLDRAGAAELVTPFRESEMAFYRPGRDPRSGFQQHLVGAPNAPGCRKFSHGLGVGDVNGDGRADILCKDGYYEAPSGPGKAPWRFVRVPLGPDCAQMYTHDFDGDGDMDVISSSAHAVGVWWHEHLPGRDGPAFRQHVIDDTFSQSHSLVMADLNGDRQPDFVTGKRWWAHGPNGDVNPNHPAVLYWYEFRRESGRVVWTRHQIDDDSGVGTQFTVADVNGDRRPDVVTANKKGVFLFEQAGR